MAEILLPKSFTAWFSSAWYNWNIYNEEKFDIWTKMEAFSIHVMGTFESNYKPSRRGEICSFKSHHQIVYVKPIQLIFELNFSSKWSFQFSALSLPFFSLSFLSDELMPWRIDHILQKSLCTYMYKHTALYICTFNVLFDSQSSWISSLKVSKRGNENLLLLL